MLWFNRNSIEFRINFQQFSSWIFQRYKFRFFFHLESISKATWAPEASHNMGNVCSWCFFVGVVVVVLIAITWNVDKFVPKSAFFRFYDVLQQKNETHLSRLKTQLFRPPDWVAASVYRVEAHFDSIVKPLINNEIRPFTRPMYGIPFMDVFAYKTI